MKDTTKLEISTSSKLLKKAEKKANVLGFASVGDMLNSVLSYIVSGRNDAEYIVLGPKAKKRWAQIDKDVKEGKNLRSFRNPDDALVFLLSDKS